MEESTFETFEDELGAPLEEEKLPTKSVRQIRRPGIFNVHASRKTEEQEPPSPQHAGTSKPVQRETRRAMSIQNLSRLESSWDVITLNRCLFAAITILLISSGFQRLHEALKALRAGEEDGASVGGGLTLRRVGLKQDRAPPQPESSLWGSLFWWVLEDDDDEEEDEESPVGETRMEDDGGCGASGRVKHQDTPGRAGRAREKRKKKMGRGREEEEEEDVKGKRGREKRQREEGEEEEEEVGSRRKQKEESELREKEKGSEVTAAT